MLMNRAMKFRRRLNTAGIAAIVILLLALYAAYRSASQAENMNWWVGHTETVLKVIERTRLERSQLENEAWAYHATPDPDSLMRFQTNLLGLRGDVDRLRQLTADNAAQQKTLDELIPIMHAQVASLEAAMQRGMLGGATAEGASFYWSLRGPALEQQRQLFESLDANERVLLVKRAAAAQANNGQTWVVLLSADLFGIVMLLIAGHVIQREILMRAKVESGIRLAQEMLGLKFQEKRGELDQALGDLHAQIRARREAEAVILDLHADLEWRVRQRSVELEESNRELEALRHSVSHDLRAPLRHLDESSRMLQQEYGPKLPAEAQHYLSGIVSATHVSELVENLLQLSRIGREPAQREVCSLRALVEEARAEMLQESDRRKIVWQIYSLPEVEADPALLRQVLTHLFSNAVKFTRQQRTAVIEVGSLTENGMTVVFVRDNGAGFDPCQADKLFGAFQRLHRQEEFEGTGIGLATVQRIIQKHGGRVWAESQPGQGATFYFSLPACVHNSRELEEIIGAVG
jgi:signal transduction histidine kinase